MDRGHDLLHRLERLARLNLEESEREQLLADLDRILSYMDQVVASRTHKIIRPSDAGPATRPRRTDEPVPGLAADTALALAPASEPGYYSVPPLAVPRHVRDVLRLSLDEARRAVRDGELEPTQAGRELGSAAMQDGCELRAYCWLAPTTPDPTLLDATPPNPLPPRLTAGPLLPAACPLEGLGYALKANIACTAGPTDCASRILAGYRSPYDATVVARLHAAGARLLGKTNMDEFGMGSSTEHSAHGPTRNPWRLDRVPGGSSGGSAAAVAADLAFFALGSDTGGSVRLPAHCCGVVGLKPTYGRVSRYGLVAFASSLDVIGTLTKDVRDAALVYAVIAGHDPRDATSCDVPVGDPRGALDQPARGLRVGVPWRLLEAGVAPEVEADLRSVIADLRAAGVTVLDIELPAAELAVAAYYILCTAEASSNLARYDGVRYGARATAMRQAGTAAHGAAAAVPAQAKTWQAMVEATRGNGFGREVKRRILLGTFVLSEGYYEAYYLRALGARARLAADFQRAFAGCDAIALPTAPTTAFPLGAKLRDPLQMYLNDAFTVPASLAGLPAITVPTGVDSEGLPLSVQLVAPALAEERLFTLAAAVERTRDFRMLKEATWRGR